MGGHKELPDVWLTTATAIRETGREVFCVLAGKRTDKETLWWNEEVRESNQKRKRLARNKWERIEVMEYRNTRRCNVRRRGKWQG